MRVYELAKELGKSNKELLNIVSEKDASIKSHSSSLTDELAAYIRSRVNAGGGKREKTDVFVAGEHRETMQSKENLQHKEHSKHMENVLQKIDAKQTDNLQHKEHSKHMDNLQHKEHSQRGEERSGKPVVSDKKQGSEEKKDGKKKLTAVFRPQNVQHAVRNRPNQQKQGYGKYVPVSRQGDGKYSDSRALKPNHAPRQDAEHLRPEPGKTEHAQGVRKANAEQIVRAEQTMNHEQTASTKQRTGSDSNVNTVEAGFAKKSAEHSAVRSNEATNPAKTSAASDGKAEGTGESRPVLAVEKTVDNTSAPRVNVYDNLKLQKAEPIKPVRNIFENNPQARADAGNRGANRTVQNRSQGGSRGFDGNRNSQRGENRGYGDRSQNGQSNRPGGDNRGQGFQRGADGRDYSRNQGGSRPFGDNRSQGGARVQNGNRSFGDKSGFHKGFMDGGFDKDKDAAPRTFQKPKTAGKPSMDTPMAKKTSSSRLSKNQFKNQKDEKKNRTEDGPVKGGKVSRHPFIMPVRKEEAKVEDIKEIIIPALITIKDLAAELKLNASSIVKKLFLKGEICTINTEIPFEKAEEIALEYDVICTQEEVIDEVQVLTEDTEDAPETLKPRPPVVCVVGHIDHGKTSLLDAIRKTSVTAREAGGITQHIGAYMVEINGQPLTFLDTPGHEAFTSMRMRGAQSTDFAILVVAADDGVMPQTVEAINHAKAAGIEIIVAINKIDKQGVNLDRVRQELSEHELIPEDWGGTTVFCEVSAKTGLGIENLLEMILLTAEMKELKANPDRMARGVVIEAKLDKGKGPVATVLVQKGTLKDGDFVSAGSSFGKVRAMTDHNGKRVKKATPSTPVEIQGLDSVPNAGDILMVGDSLSTVKNNAEVFKNASKDKLIEETKAKLSLNDLFSKIKEGELKELPIIIKGDVQGSVEALKQSLLKLSNEEVTVRIVHSGVGAISESDVSLAAASNTIIIGYGVRIDSTAQTRANEENVDVKLYKIIYDAINDVESAMKGMLAPVYEEKVIGTAEIRKVYKASGIGSIAGSYITSGKFQRGCKVRISRGSELIFDGNLAGLKRFQDDVKEVASGYECGLSFEKFNDIQELDTIEAYMMVEVPRK